MPARPPVQPPEITHDLIYKTLQRLNWSYGRGNLGTIHLGPSTEGCATGSAEILIPITQRTTRTETAYFSVVTKGTKTKVTFRGVTRSLNYREKY